MGGRDAANTGRNSVAGPDRSATVSLVYDDRGGDHSSLLGGTVPTASAPAVVDDVAYLPGGSVDVGDGTVLRTADRSSERATPAVAHAHVFRTASERTTAISLDDGERRWTVDVGHPTVDPVVHDDTVYVASTKRDEGLIALEAAGGERRWTYAHALGRITGVAVAGDHAYVTETGDSESGTGRVTALDRRTGEVAWYEPLEQVLVGPVADSDGVFVGTEGGTLYAFDETGDLRWDTDVVDGRHGFVTSRPALGERRVFVPGNNGRVTAGVDRATGEIDWERKTGLTNGPPAVGDDFLYVGTANDGIQVLSTEGEHQWTVDAPSVSSGLALVEDRLYFVTGTGLFEVS